MIINDSKIASHGIFEVYDIHLIHLAPKKQKQAKISLLIAILEIRSDSILIVPNISVI